MTSDPVVWSAANQAATWLLSDRTGAHVDFLELCAVVGIAPAVIRGKVEDLRQRIEGLMK